VSISFDKYLKTIVSYNGGEKLSPPGLNYELLQNYNKKPDSSIMVYKLKCDIEQKEYIIGRIKKINEEGSAYNLFGLVTKYSHKQNIMFCSQFIYKMLKDAGLSYFEKEETEVKPMDLVELDYQRKLEYVYEINISDIL
jgi:glutamate synthase domain-containing protein 2